MVRLCRPALELNVLASWPSPWLGRVTTFTSPSVACASVWLIWRFASAATWERTDPAILFAPLSHMLMKGFFFNQGLLM